MEPVLLATLIGAAVTVIAAIIGGLTARVLINLDRNQKALSENIKSLWSSHNTLSADFYVIKGAHEVNHAYKGPEKRHGG